MQRNPLIALSLTCVMAISGCATNGPVLPPTQCPQLPQPPASLMNPPQYERELRQRLFQSVPEQMPKSGRSKPL